MRTTTRTARGKPLAALFLFLALACTSGAVWGEGSLQVEQSLSPAEINVVGAGAKPDTAIVSITLRGETGIDRYPLDCVVVIDTSASARLGEAKAFAFDLINQLDSVDRVGVVSFGTTAELVVPLTPDKTEAKVAIGDLVAANKSALGAALQLARQELQRYGRDGAVLSIVLIADGQNNVGAAPTVEGMVAGETGIRIVSVGLAPIINPTLLSGLAQQSGGIYVKDLSTETALTIARHLETTASATDVVVTKHVPPGLHYIGGTPAAQTRAERDGSTTLTWRIAQVALGQAFRIDAKFDAPAKGNVATDDLSKVAYRDFRGVAREASLSPLVVKINMPNRAPVASFAYEPTAPGAGESVSFRDTSRDLDEDPITSWEWNFGDGTTSSVSRPDHTYGAAGTYTVSLRVADGHGLASETTTRAVAVADAKPVARFGLRDAQTNRGIPAALIGGKVVLDASGSTDLEGKIVLYGWDLDDDGDIDETTTGPTLETTFPEPGEYTVGLTVTDEKGNVSTTTLTFTVVSSLTVERTINTYLPDDETIAGAVVEVTIVISANALFDGLAMSETIPSGWSFRSTEPDGAQVKFSSASNTAEWLFDKRLEPGSENSQRQIRYELTSPATAPNANKQSVTLSGRVFSSSPRMSQTTLGEDQITVLKFLSVPVAISCWDVKAGAVDVRLGVNGAIASDQVQYAMTLWFSGAVVPRTDNATISLATMSDLIAYWLTKTSVYDPLP